MVTSPDPIFFIFILHFTQLSASFGSRFIIKFGFNCYLQGEREANIVTMVTVFFPLAKVTLALIKKLKRAHSKAASTFIGSV